MKLDDLPTPCLVLELGIHRLFPCVLLRGGEVSIH